VKFVCDRCKTRYSIGDDRVRGKILKIRCKNCANVITVREGMPPPDVPESAPGGAVIPRRTHKTTTAAPAIQSEAPAPVAPAPSAGSGALGAAFASAMAKPPPALEEEWYVSIDGEQAGPFSLTEAQRWVAAKRFDDDLFCWSEGFDDWLPVDKVSHFRGLRKRPAPATVPPPLPRSPTGALRAVVPRGETEEEPKPLFAATMAQLEKDSAVSELRSLAMAAPAPAPAPAAPAPFAAAPAPAPPTPLRGITGSLRSAAAALNGHANGAPQKARAGLPPPVAATPQPQLLKNAPPRVTTQPGLGAKAPLKAFDASDHLDAATEIAAPSFDTGPASALGADAAVTAPRLPALDRPAPPPIDPGDGDDDLDIGEVSRVVKLADLARGAREPAAAPPAVRAGAAPKLGEHLPGPFANGTGDAAALLREGAVPEVPRPVAVSHRRALIALIAGAIVLVGVAVAVVFFVLADDGSSGRSSLGTVEEIDTTRPEVVRPFGGGAPETAEPPPNPLVPRPPRRIVTPPVTPPVTPEVPGTGARLDASEIEDMASKNSSVTQRCYMRAQRGADGILLGDVKKISVTLTINGDGLVTDTQLSDNHAQNTLGKCLIGAIRLWKFRASPGGTFRFVLHFG
jgi:predicted Zn finger-like uncharacterized protein